MLILLYIVIMFFFGKKTLVFSNYEFLQLTSHVTVGEVSSVPYCCVTPQKDTVGDYIYIYIYAYMGGERDNT